MYYIQPWKKAVSAFQLPLFEFPAKRRRQQKLPVEGSTVLHGTGGFSNPVISVLIISNNKENNKLLQNHYLYLLYIVDIKGSVILIVRTNQRFCPTATKELMPGAGSMSDSLRTL